MDFAAIAAELARWNVIADADIEHYADLSTIDVDELIALRSRIAAATASIDADAATDDDIAMLSAARDASVAIAGEFENRRGDVEKRRLAVAKLVDAVTASAEVAPPPSSRLPSISRLAHRTPRSHAPVARRNGTGPRIVTASGEPAREDELLDILGHRMEREWRDRNSWKEGREAVLMASLRVDYDEARMLGEDEILNQQKLDAVCLPAALLASGGVCGPVGVDYSVTTIAQAGRPVRDSLAQFGANRGGLRYVLPHTLAAVTADGPASVWTAANDVSLNSPATKPHATFVCQSVQEALVDAITSVTQFGNFQSRYFPEQIAQYLETVDAVHARLAESTILAAMTTGSTQVSAGLDLLGAASEVLATIDRASAAMRYRNRMAPEAPLRLLYPEWLEDMIRTDLARRLPGDSGGRSERLAVADAEIDNFFSVRGINVTNVQDSPTGAAVFQGFAAQGAGLLNPWPDDVLLWLYPEGSWVFLDGGELNLGMVRDSTLNRTNDLQMFSESFEKVIFRGHESLCIDLEICPSGTTAATANTSAYCTSQS